VKPRGSPRASPSGTLAFPLEAARSNGYPTLEHWQSRAFQAASVPLVTPVHAGPIEVSEADHQAFDMHNQTDVVAAAVRVLPRSPRDEARIAITDCVGPSSVAQNQNLKARATRGDGAGASTLRRPTARTANRYDLSVRQRSASGLDLAGYWLSTAAVVPSRSEVFACQSLNFRLVQAQGPEKREGLGPWLTEGDGKR